MYSESVRRIMGRGFNLQKGSHLLSWFLWPIQMCSRPFHEISWMMAEWRNCSFLSSFKFPGRPQHTRSPMGTSVNCQMAFHTNLKWVVESRESEMPFKQRRESLAWYISSHNTKLQIGPRYLIPPQGFWYWWPLLGTSITWQYLHRGSLLKWYSQCGKESIPGISIWNACDRLLRIDSGDGDDARRSLERGNCRDTNPRKY